MRGVVSFDTWKINYFKYILTVDNDDNNMKNNKPIIILQKYILIILTLFTVHQVAGTGGGLWFYVKD